MIGMTDHHTLAFIRKTVRQSGGFISEDQGVGLATGKAVDAIARQPEAESKISKSLLLGCALAEATAIYGFVIGLLIIFFLG